MRSVNNPTMAAATAGLSTLIVYVSGLFGLDVPLEAATAAASLVGYGVRCLRG